MKPLYFICTAEVSVPVYEFLIEKLYHSLPFYEIVERIH